MAAGALLASLVVAAMADPLGPARAGQMQCYAPEPRGRTCVALAAYDWDGEGRIANTAYVLVAPDPVIIARTVSPVMVRGDAVCGPLRRIDFEQAEITVAGRPAAPALAQRVRRELMGAMSGEIGQEVCTTYVPIIGAYIAKITIDGVAHPELSARVIWVSPQDGYRVAPR
jgi:hypothetical protein